MCGGCGGGSAGVERRQGKRGLIFVFLFLELSQGLRAAVLLRQGEEGEGARHHRTRAWGDDDVAFAAVSAGPDGRRAGGGSGGGGCRGEDAGRLLPPPRQRHGAPLQPKPRSEGVLPAPAPELMKPPITAVRTPFFLEGLLAYRLAARNNFHI